MRELLLNSLRHIRENLSQYPTPYFDENATKQGIILRILDHLGWDIFNPNEVCPEYSTGSGRVDYALKLYERLQVFIEVKKVGAELFDREEEQILRYAFDKGVRMAILTNGQLWRFYLPLKEGDWRERLFWEFDIKRDELESITDRLILLLSKDSIGSGNAFEEAEKIFAQARQDMIAKKYLPIIWKNILEKPDDILVELIRSKMQEHYGFTINPDKIKEFLQSLITPSKEPPSQIPRPIPTSPDKPPGRISPPRVGEKEALEMVYKWLKEQFKVWPLNQPFAIGDVARKSRKVAHIRPEGNRWGMRQLLQRLQSEGYVKILDHKTFMIIKRPE